MSAAGACCFAAGIAGRRRTTSSSARSPKRLSRASTVTSSTGSRLCSIAPTPICSTGSWAAAGRRQSTIMTSCGCCAASAPRAVTDHPSTTGSVKAENQEPDHGTSDIAFHVPDLVPLPGYLCLVDPSPPHWDRVGSGFASAGRLARRRGGGWSIVRDNPCLHRLAGRHDAAVRLVGRVLLSPVQRASASRLGRGLRLRTAAGLSQRLCGPGRDRAADRAHLALCACGLGGRDGKGTLSIERDRTTR